MNSKYRRHKEHLDAIVAQRSREDAELFAYLNRQADQLEHPTRCCARCARGTRAIPGPCGYGLQCPNRCHQKAGAL